MVTALSNLHWLVDGGVNWWKIVGLYVYKYAWDSHKPNCCFSSLGSSGSGSFHQSVGSHGSTSTRSTAAGTGTAAATRWWRISGIMASSLVFFHFPFISLLEVIKLELNLFSWNFVLSVYLQVVVSVLLRPIHKLLPSAVRAGASTSIELHYLDYRFQLGVFVRKIGQNVDWQFYFNFFCPLGCIWSFDVWRNLLGYAENICER